jgi:hypothetical protein
VTGTLTLDVEVAAATGVVGARQLVLVQTIDIARLTAHAVPIIPGTFIAVGGRGPKSDSNESGKTSFLAALALLLGDAEWRTSSQGGAAAAAILFEPETAGVSAQQWAAATHGYIVGLFAHPGAVSETALSVWLKISATKPYLTARWREGVVFPEYPSRRLAVDEQFQELGSKYEAGAATYVSVLYGDQPRCLAYVSRRGNAKARASLLQMSAGAFKPDEIANDLITLTGRSTIYEQEHELRKKLFSAQQEIATQTQEHASTTAHEETQLSTVAARNRAREEMARGAELWRLHFAAGLLEVTEEMQRRNDAKADLEKGQREASEAVSAAEAAIAALDDEAALEAALSRAEAAHSEIETAIADLNDQAVGARTRADLHRDEMNKIRSLAQSWVSGTASDALGAVTGATAHHADAIAAYNGALLERSTAQRLLEEALAGRDRATAETLSALERAGISGHGLLHAIEIADDARVAWESRLCVLAAAVAVPEASLPDALTAVAALPGAFLVAKDVDGPLPGGIRHAPPGSTALLHTLSSATSTEALPPSAFHVHTGVHVVGGFTEEQTGGATRVAAARRTMSASAKHVLEMKEGLDQALVRLQRAGDDLEQARAHERMLELGDRVGVEEDRISTRATRQARLATPKRDAFTALLAANTALQTRGSEVRRLTAEKASSEDDLKDVREKLEILDTALEDLERRREWWASGWGGAAADAASSFDGRRQDARTLGNAASEALNRALREVGVGVEPEDALDPKIAEAVRNRRAVSGSTDDERVQFPRVLVPLEEWLDGLKEQDLVVAERIAVARNRRTTQLEIATTTAQQLATELESMQDAVEERIRRALDDISTHYDRLDREVGGFGATIEITCERPTVPTATWVWRATPRWRRSARSSMLPYDHQTNSAQEKQQTVQLVLAALLSSSSAAGRVLILDELGDSLGVEHRRQVLQTIAQAATTRGFTVIATCQDAVLSDATRFCAEVLYFEYRSKTEAKNRPTRVLGFDGNRNRVILTVDHVLRDRPLG